MTRILTPTPTRGAAPSHSPPDTVYAPGAGLARGLGWFSIGLGLAEVLAPRAMADLTGVGNPRLLQAFGLREIVCGVGILADPNPRPAGWMWARVAGDAMDLVALLANLAGADRERRGRVLAAAAAVLGVTVLDVLGGLQLSAAAALEG